MSELITAIGLIFVIEGLIYALAPGRLKGVLSLIERLPEETLRRGGVAAMAAGVLLVWVGRSVLSGT